MVQIIIFANAACISLKICVARDSEPRHANGVVGDNVNSKDSDQLAKPYSLINDFAIRCYILQYPITLYADSDGPSLRMA